MREDGSGGGGDRVSGFGVWLGSDEEIWLQDAVKQPENRSQGVPKKEEGSRIHLFDQTRYNISGLGDIGSRRADRYSGNCYKSVTRNC